MRTLAIVIGLLLIEPAPAPAGDDAGDKTPAQRVKALQDEYDAAFEAFVKADREGKSTDDYPGLKPILFAPRFMALAKEFPGTEAAEDALVWIGSQVLYGRESEEAKRLLTRDHIRSAKLAPVFAFHWNTPGSAASEKLLREALDKNPSREVQGLAAYWLGRYLMNQADWSRAIRKGDFANREDSPQVVEAWGADYRDRLARLDPEALDREAEALFVRVAKVYPDFPHNDKRHKPGSLGQLARGYVHEQQDLVPGKPAPKTEGVDMDGKPFLLSDYRGKVVVLVFGSHFFCGSCNEKYPQERDLAKTYDGRPFALLSINTDPDPDELKKARAAEDLTWRCVWDGRRDGPINISWNVTFFPTLYVIDRSGVIRHKNIYGKELDEAVAKLMAESDPPKPE